MTYKKGKANNVTANAAFKSKSKRELMDLSEAIQNPAPGILLILNILNHTFYLNVFTISKYTFHIDYPQTYTLQV